MAEMDRDASVSAERVIKAPPQQIFEVLADPARHPEFDGSGTVKGALETDGPVDAVGDTFSMSMRYGLPYRMVNRIVEFDRDKRITWEPHLHVGRFRPIGGQWWRYELKPVPEGTRVTETYVWGRSKVSWALKTLRYPERMLPAMERTLDRLADLVEAGDSSGGTT